MPCGMKFGVRYVVRLSAVEMAGYFTVGCAALASFDVDKHLLKTKGFSTEIVKWLGLPEQKTM